VALCLCQVGATLAMVSSMVQMLHGMHHSTRTAFGDSRISQGRREWGEPITGIGQGNGVGPQIWVAVSSPLFDIMRSEGFFALLVGAILGHSRKLAGFAFIDDTNLIVMDIEQNGVAVTRKMQAAVAEWEALLSSTGGALVPEKCFWYMVNFEFHGSKWKYLEGLKPMGLAVHNAAGQATSIPQLPVVDARQTLGIRVAPDGNNTAEFEHLNQIATEWFTKMKAGWLTHEVVAFSLRNVVLKQLEYPLVTMMFMERECNSIMQPILAAGLPAMGVVQILAWVVVPGPLWFQGLNIPNLYMEQLITRLQALLQYRLQLEDVTGRMIRYTAEA